MRRALREQLWLDQVGNKIRACIGHPLPSLPAEDMNVFTTAAARFGLEALLTFERIHSETSSDITTRLEQIVRNRTSENEMRIAALRVAASKPHGRATTTELKREVDQYVALTREDLLPSKTRPSEAMYQQIVGNLVSHRESRNNIFAKGWAVYTGDGIQITDAGRQHLRTLGLS